MNRRFFLSLVGGFSAAPQISSPPARFRVASTIPLPAPYENQTATLVELNFAVGAPSGAPHRHPGFVLGYVIEGEIRFQVAGEPVRILRAGDTFFEPPGARHLLTESASLDRPARALAIVIADSGMAITEPV